MPYFSGHLNIELFTFSNFLNETLEYSSETFAEIRILNKILSAQQ